MKPLICLIMLGIASHAFGCDLTAGPGAALRMNEGKSGGIATIGCVDHKWEVRLWWIGEQRIYEDTVTIEAYPAISASKLWTFREGKRFQPILGMGVMLKESQRCHFNGDLDCNRQLPLSFCFLPQAGFRWGDVLVTAFHCSNASLDWGPEKKNLGLDGIRAEVWF